MHDLLFWYTGWLVWATIALIIALAIGFTAIAIVIRANRAAKEWYGIKVLRRAVSEEEQDIVRGWWPALPNDIPHASLLRWLRSVGEAEKERAALEAKDKGLA